MNENLDDIMQRVTLPELIDLIRGVLDEIELRAMAGIAGEVFNESSNEEINSGI